MSVGGFGAVQYALHVIKYFFTHYYIGCNLIMWHLNEIY